VSDNTDKKSASYFKWLKEFVLFIAAFILIASGLDYYRFKQYENGGFDQPLLRFVQQQFDEKQLQKFNQGSPALVYVWASWCGVCNLTSPAVSSIANDYPVASIALKSGLQKEVNRYLAEKNYQFSAYADRQGELAARLNVESTPYFFIVDKRGEIQFVSRGINTELGLRAKLALLAP